MVTKSIGTRKQDFRTSFERFLTGVVAVAVVKPRHLKNVLGSKFLTAGALKCVSNSISARELGRFKFLRRSVPAFLGFSRNRVEKQVSGTRG